MATTDMINCIHEHCIFNGSGECKTPCNDVIPTSFSFTWTDHKGDSMECVYFRSQPGYFWEKIYVNGKPPKRPRRITRKDYIFNWKAIQEEKAIMEFYNYDE